MDDVFNSVPVGLYRTALGGRLLEANPTLAELLACPSVDDLLGSNVIDFYANPVDRMRLVNALDRQGASARFEAQLRRRNGTTFWAEIFARRVDEGPEPSLVGMVTELARLLTDQYPGLKVIFTSGYTDRGRGGLENDVDLMEKPFTPTTLLNRVRTTLDRRD